VPHDTAERAAPRHWHGDLPLGVGTKSVIGALVERSAWFVMLAAPVAMPTPKLEPVVLTESDTIGEVAQELGVSRNMVSKWRSRFHLHFAPTSSRLDQNRRPVTR
jgi:hypothetical protein